MNIEQLIDSLNSQATDFSIVMNVIDTHFDFTATQFQNGDQNNEADTNNGSCKIFAFGQNNQLSEQATLNAFGTYYTQDVLQNPNATDHANIRNFMVHGWAGIQFSGHALTLK